MLRSLSALALALAICACEPDLPQVTPTPTVTAMFDPTNAEIPLPNDLVFFSPVNTVCPAPGNAMTAPTDPPACAQAELITSFAAAGNAFPSDQEVAITIDFTETTYVEGRTKQIPPALDLTTLTPANLFVIGKVGATVGPIQLATPTAADYAMGTDRGTLTLHHLDHQPWATGQYTLVMRGGDMGVKTTDGIPVTPSSVFDLIEQGKDMTLPENLGLLKAQNNGSTADALAQGAQLNLLIALYKATAFPAADNVFPHEQLAIAATFTIAETKTNVTVDPARGLAPLPFDLLRDANSGKITATAACSLAGSSLNPDGTCMSPAAAGFTTLDGFSTTGAILAPTSDLIAASTVTKNSLLLFDLSGATPAQVDASTLIVEPCEFTSGCNAGPALSPVIALQPAGATADAGQNTPLPSVFRTKPLKDNTDYAVVLTTAILDKAGKALAPGTVANVLRFQNPLFVGGHSALQGIDDGTAASLEKMRKQLAPLLAKNGAVAAAGVDPANVAMAYTFHTQTILSPAVQLAALPYTAPASTAVPMSDAASFKVETPDDAYAKFGATTVPHDAIDEILEADITTFNALDPTTGAFLADPSKAALETIHVLIATPKPTAVPLCPAAPNPLSAFERCAPLMVFRHGLKGGRADMLLIANTFAAAGMVTVAIDAAKHGDRTLCSTNPDPASTTGTGCAVGSACLPIAGAAGQGDPVHPGAPGTCDGNKLAKHSLDNHIVDGTTLATDGIPDVSGNYLVSANLFRTRDTLRQDLIDQSQLIRVMTFVPTAAGPTGDAVFDEILSHAATTTGSTMIVDPTTVYFTGQSLGAIQGTLDVATNPRISKAGLNVGGGTITDIFSTSPSFQTEFGDLLGAFKIAPTDTARLLQFLTVAKTVLDPADPVNFAGHLTAHTLPNLLPPLGGNQNGSVPQTAKKVLIQVANCDQVVPNPTGVVWASNVLFAGGAPGPLPAAATGPFQLFVGPGFDLTDPASQFLHPETCSEGTAAQSIATLNGGHGLLLNFGNPPPPPSVVPDPTLTLTAQSDLAAFVTQDTLPPSFRKRQ